jgi:hypothetical protein
MILFHCRGLVRETEGEKVHTGPAGLSQGTSGQVPEFRQRAIPIKIVSKTHVRRGKLQHTVARSRGKIPLKIL